LSWPVFLDSRHRFVQFKYRCENRKTVDIYGAVKKPNQNFRINPFRNFTNSIPLKTINFTADRPIHLNLWLEVPILSWNRLKKCNIREREKKTLENIPAVSESEVCGVDGNDDNPSIISNYIRNGETMVKEWTKTRLS